MDTTFIGGRERTDGVVRAGAREMIGARGHQSDEDLVASDGLGC